MFNIEDGEAKIELPNWLNMILVFICFSQNAGYILSTYTVRPILEK